MREIEACPYLWGWDKAPEPSRSIYLEVEGYGIVCLIFKMEHVELHAVPNNTISLKKTIRAFDDICDRCKSIGSISVIAKYDVDTSDTLHNLLTKHLKFEEETRRFYRRLL